MYFTFVRHGETDWNKAGRMTGRTDMPLNEEGKAQARRITRDLSLDFDAIVSSPLKRALETANIIQEKLKVPIVIDTSFAERDFGSLSGKTWSEINEEVGFDARQADTEQRYDYRPFGGESAGEVKERMLKGIGALKEKAYMNPLVVCHGGVIRMLHFFSKKEYTHIPNSSIHTFEF